MRLLPCLALVVMLYGRAGRALTRGVQQLVRSRATLGRPHLQARLSLARFMSSPAQETPAAAATVDYYSVAADSEIAFGDFKQIASQGRSGRVFASARLLGQPGGAQPGDVVWLRGRVSSVRAKGNACFAILRCDAMHTVQACHFKDKENPEASKHLIKFTAALPLETIVDVMGVVAAADVKSCTQSNVEIQIRKIFAVSRAPVVLPFLLEDAARPQEDIDASQDTDRPLVGVSQDQRLNNRWLDLRVPANHAIMRVRSGVLTLFREALLQEGFTEISSPKLIAGESEGGSDVFRTGAHGEALGPY